MTSVISSGSQHENPQHFSILGNEGVNTKLHRLMDDNRLHCNCLLGRRDFNLGLVASDKREEVNPCIGIHF